MNVSDRQKQILKAIINEYMGSGAPVGSSTLVKKYDIPASPATVRYEMAHLSSEGLVEKPHKSAGRIPSTTGLRYYLTNLYEDKVVDYMLELDLKKRLNKVKFERELLLREAVSVLAEQSGGLGFCVMEDGPRVGGISNLLVLKKDTLAVIFAVLEDDTAFADVLKGEDTASIKALLGDEIGLAGMSEAAIVYKDVTLYGEKGWFGVLGPIWMDYRTILPVLATIVEIAESEAAHWGKGAEAPREAPTEAPQY